jgi:hypothetical protein
MVADLLMQLNALGVIALLFPPLVWSLRLVRFHLFDRGALKLGLWIVAVAATAAVGSALPATPRWPLPTGMGGVIGDGLLFGTRNLAGIAGNAVGGLVGFLYAGIAILAVTAAAGFGFVSDEDPVLDEDEGPAGGVGAGCPTLEVGWRAPTDAGLILGLDVRDADDALLLPWTSVEDAGTFIATALELCLERGAVVRMAASADLNGDGGWDTHSCINDGEGFVTVGRAAAAYAGRELGLRITPAPTSDGCELSATVE